MLKETIRQIVDEMWENEFRFHGGLSTNAAAEFCGIHPQTLRNHVHQGKIRPRGSAASWRFRVPDLVKYIRDVT